MGTFKAFLGLHLVRVRDFGRMRPKLDLYVCKCKYRNVKRMHVYLGRLWKAVRKNKVKKRKEVKEKRKMRKGKKKRKVGVMSVSRSDDLNITLWVPLLGSGSNVVC